MRLNSKFSWTHASLVAILMLVMVFLFAACTYDHTPAVQTQDEALVVISLNVPVSSRSLTVAEEDAVRNIQVLAFDADGKYAFSAQSNNSADSKTFNVRLRKGTWDLVVLANASYALIGLVEGTPQDELLAGLTATITAGTGWTTADLKEYGIPMSSALLPDTDIHEDTTVGDVDLYRMIAKVDISVIAENFTLETVRVYNYERMGALFPVISEGTPQFALPSAQSDKVKGYLSDELIYNKVDYPDGMSETFCERVIYLNPSAAGTKTTLDENTCLVVGGRYADDEAVTYYRVDFSTGDGTYIDLVRNHKYMINISKVGGRGEATENDAFDREPVNMTVEIVAWNEADVVDVVVDGRYALGVSKKDFVFYAGAVAAWGWGWDVNKLTVSTTYTGTWEIASDSDWLTITRNSTTKDSHTCDGSQSTSVVLSEDFYLNLSANTTGETRTGWITVRAGRLNQRVEVTQNTTPTHSLGVYAPSTYFPATASTLTYRVESNTTWSAVSNQEWCTISPSSGSGNVSIQLTTTDNPGRDSRMAVITVLTTSGVPVRMTTNTIEQYGQTATLHISTNSLDFPCEEIESTVSLSSNVSWSISSDQDWCTVSPRSGSGFREITISTTANTGSERKAYVTITTTSGGTLTEIIEVIQAASLRVGAAPRITVDNSGTSPKLVLTNDPTDAGLYFKFGSVVGIYSAAEGRNQKLPGTNTDPYKSDDVAFNPTELSFEGWDNIPVYKWSMTESDHTLANIREGMGDPCRLVGYTAQEIKDATTVPDNNTWRMPTIEENGSFSGYTSTTSSISTHWWFKETSPFSGVVGAEFPKKREGGPGKFLPAAGYRNPTGAVSGVEDYGYYWSTTKNNYLGFIHNTIYINEAVTETYGFNIRCVPQTPE